MARFLILVVWNGMSWSDWEFIVTLKEKARLRLKDMLER